MLKYHKWIVDTVHGYIGLTKAEIGILDHSSNGFSPMQRLRGVSQLGWVSLTYPTATHTRFEHSLGTMHLAGRIAENIGLSDKLVQKARIAALLHDVGHGPFSHDSETVLRFFKGISHEDMTERIINGFYRLEDYGFKTKEVAKEAVGKKKDIVSQILFGVEEHSRLSIDADFLDYIVRDDFYCGVRITAVDLTRIIRSFRKVGKQLVLSSEALLPATSAINARNHLALRVYFHKTSEFAESMWIKALYNAIKEGLDLDRLWLMGDFEALHTLGEFGGVGGALVSRLRKRDVNKWVVVGKLEGYTKVFPIKRARCEALDMAEVKKLTKFRSGLDLKEEVEAALSKELKTDAIICVPVVPTFDVKDLKSSLYFSDGENISKYEDFMPLDNVVETNKMAFNISLTVPSKDRKRVSRLLERKKVFKDIVSRI
jgi:HD superfamily phosphohydrolase